MGARELLLETVELHADTVFLIDALNGERHTYGEFHRMACNVAIRLKDHGVVRGDRVAAVMNNCVEFVVLYFGCLYLGAVAVPVNPQLHRNTVSFILEASKPKAVILTPATAGLVDRDLLARLNIHALRVAPTREKQDLANESHLWAMGDPSAEHERTWEPLTGVGSGDWHSVFYTSGTTSFPKGVPHTIGSMVSNARAFNSMQGLGPQNRFYHVLPMAYMAGFLNSILSPFLAGSSVVVHRAFDARLALSFWEAAIRFEANCMWLAPTILASILRLDRGLKGSQYCRDQVKAIFVGTAPLPMKLKRDFEDKFGKSLLESYGLSETLIVTANTWNSEYKPGSVGLPLPGIGLRIADESGNEMPPGADGDIWIRSASVTPGYLDDNSLPDVARQPGGWFPSGDIGHIGPDGYLFITGRKKDLIIRGGINLSPRAIEEVLAEHEAVDDVAVVGVPDEFYGEEIVAVVKLKDGYALAAIRTELLDLCKSRLSPGAVPGAFVDIREFPLSSTGKIQKGKLREMVCTGRSRGADHVAP